MQSVKKNLTLFQELAKFPDSTSANKLLNCNTFGFGSYFTFIHHEW